MADSWDKYGKEMKDTLKEHPSIINAINNMKRKGYEKATTQRITGAPYELVDRIYGTDTNDKK